MSVKQITTDDLRRMNGKEGLILQGCGGDLDEWVEHINDMMTQEEYFLDGSRFTDCAAFIHDGLTCLLFPFREDMELDMGKLAMWRLQTYVAFRGTWLSDFVSNKLGGFITAEQEIQKPDCPLIGADGNIYNLTGIAMQTLMESDLKDQAVEMSKRVLESGSYDEALGIIGEYVNIVSVDEMEEMDEGMGM